MLSVSGPTRQMTVFGEALKRYPKVKKEAENRSPEGIELFVLRAAKSLQYRDIGGLIFEAQRLRLAIVITPSMPLCEDKAK